MQEIDERRAGNEALVLRYRGCFHLFALILMVFSTCSLAFSFQLQESDRISQAHFIGVGVLGGVAVVFLGLRSRTRILVDSNGVSISIPLARQRHIPWDEVFRVVCEPNPSGFVIEGRRGKKIPVSLFLQNVEGLVSIILEAVQETKYATAREELEKIAAGQGAARRFVLILTFACAFAAILAGMASLVAKSDDKEVVRTPTAEELRLVIRMEDFNAPGFDIEDYLTKCTVTHWTGRWLAVSYELRSEVKGWAIISETIIHSRRSSAKAVYRDLCRNFLEKLDPHRMRLEATLEEDHWPLEAVEGRAFQVLSKGSKIGSLAVARSGKAVHRAFIVEASCTLKELAALVADRLEQAQTFKP